MDTHLRFSTPVPVPGARGAATGLAVFAACAAVPPALVMLDVAGAVDTFGITADAPRGVLILAAIGGVATLVLAVCAVAAAVLAWSGAPWAAPAMAVIAIAGFATALLPWLPAALALGLAAQLLARRGAPSPGGAA